MALFVQSHTRNHTVSTPKQTHPITDPSDTKLTMSLLDKVSSDLTLYIGGFVSCQVLQ
jgi:hypothetical protein